MENKKVEFQPLTQIRKDQTIDGPVYMGKISSFVCRDKLSSSTVTTSLVAEHINPDAEEPLVFPRFVINKMSAIDGGYGMYSHNVLALDADDVPTEGSINLITSGTLYNILQNIQDQIDDLKFIKAE